MEGSHTAAVPPLYKAPPPTPPSPALSTDSQDSSPATFAVRVVPTQSACSHPLFLFAGI